MIRWWLTSFLIGCGPPRVVAPTATGALQPIHPSTIIDTSPKAEPRLLPAEAYARTYLALFGGLSPLEAQKRARGGEGAQLFDTWGDYLATLGFPDYKNDLPRANQTNALMAATFERLGLALCDRSAERDLGPAPPPVEERLFSFDAAPVDEAAFAPRFDQLHRAFLGYPAALAPPGRARRFFELYRGTLARHQAKDAPKSRLAPEAAAWSSVCQALVRHPEMNFY
jgi:hypothetical protein